MTQAKDAVGAYGENVAVGHLLEQGMVLLARNWRGAVGEIDAIFRDRQVLVFVEVKTRRSAWCGQPVDAVNHTKVARLRRLAAQWLAQAAISPRDVRFDVVSVWPQRRGPAVVSHLPGAF
jgi:putative endonuclease